jgi:homoserine O-succinyltransferase
MAKPSAALLGAPPWPVEGDPPASALRVNIMPRAETYETYVLRPLQASGVRFEAVWIRLLSHGYSSSDIDRVRSRYLPFEDVIGQAPLDALILTGAPVEELAFEDVRYFRELRAILEQTRGSEIPTLGLCWGGLALGHLLGLPKLVFDKKLFGVYEQRRLTLDHGITAGIPERFPCVHSSHSGILDVELERAEGADLVNLIAQGPETGYTIFESWDGLFLAHLGHPEYPAGRLLEEWERDIALGRPGVEPPQNYDPSAPRATWMPHCDRFFANWLTRARTARQARG